MADPLGRGELQRGTKPSATVSADEYLKLQQLTRKFAQSNHDMAVLDAPGMIAMWIGSKQNEGMTLEAAQQELHGKLTEWDLERYWDSVRDYAELSANHTATAQDVALLTRLARDLGKSGSLLTKYRVSHYNGTAYVIFKGNHKARAVLTGTRYLATNTKVVTMGVGKLGAAKAITGGVKITIFLSIGFRAIDTLLTEEATWAYFVGSVATDIVKLGISGAASFMAAWLAAGGAAIGTIAIGPLFVAIVAGVAVGVALNEVDDRTGFTNSLITGLREATDPFQRDVQEAKQQWYRYHRSPESTVNFWMRVFGASY